MLTLFLCVFLCACVYFTRGRSRSKSHELPPAYTRGLPLIGHTHLLLTDTANLWLRVQEAIKEAVEKGGVIHVVLGTQLYYLIADAEDALTASNACLQKHFAYDFAKPWLGDALLIAPENIWRRRRKLLNPAFSLPVIHGYLEVFNYQARKLTSIMESHVGKGSHIPTRYLMKVALESFCLAAFGNEVEDKNLADNYMISVDTILSIGTHRFQKIWLHSDFLFKLSGLKKKEQNAIDNLKSLSTKIIARKKFAMKNCTLNNSSSELKSTGMKYKSVLELLLELFKDGTLTDDEIREELDGMIAPGFETISNQLAYTLMLLGANQQVQNKMYEEILKVVGPVRDVTKEDINQLVYTNAVIMESLRVLPSVPILPRYVDKDVKLKNFTMRAGSQCILFPLVNHHDPTWGPSGDKFLPERWLADPKLNTRKEFAAFGLGKRGCLGKQFAMVSMKIFLAHFTRQYKVTADMSNLKCKIDFVLKPIAGHEISITRRNACTYSQTASN